MDKHQALLKARDLLAGLHFRISNGGHPTSREPVVKETKEFLDTYKALALGEQDEVDLFFEQVKVELRRARQLFPGDGIMTLALAEEFGELCKAVLDEDSAAVRKEAIQVAAMAARVVLDGDGSVVKWRRDKGLDQLVEYETRRVDKGASAYGHTDNGVDWPPGVSMPKEHE